MSSPVSASNNPTVPMIAVEELMVHVKVSVIEAFTDDAILEKMKTAIAPLLLPLKEALTAGQKGIWEGLWGAWNHRRHYRHQNPICPKQTDEAGFPVVIEGLEVTHRLGKPRPPPDDA